jgi:hypothetical protein
MNNTDIQAFCFNDGWTYLGLNQQEFYIASNSISLFLLRSTRYDKKLSHSRVLFSEI